MDADATSVRMNGAREALSIEERLKISGEYFSKWIGIWIQRFTCVVYLCTQNLTLETVSQKCFP